MMITEMATAPRSIYRKATGSAELLAELLPAWRLTLQRVPRDYFDRFLVRHRPRVEAAFGRLLGLIAVRRYLAARWPPDDAYFVRDQWKQERLLRQICGSDSCLLDQVLGQRREGFAFAA